jgi:glycerophosphoryl diester phosphodiesterase
VNIDVIAHRGFAGAFPENTVAAVVAAGLHPETHTVEVDVVPAGDGTPVVFHDARLEEGAGRPRPVTDAEGVVWETPLSTVTAAEVLGSDHTVPTLEAVVDDLPAGVRLNVELKNPGSDAIRPAKRLDDGDLKRQRRLWRPFVKRVAGTVEPVERVLFSSFCEAAVAEAAQASHRTAPVVPAGKTGLGLDVVREYGCTAFHPAQEAVFEDPGLVGRAVDAGCEVNAWTARTWYDVKRLREAGVHGVIADYPTLTLAGTRC